MFTDSITTSCYIGGLVQPRTQSTTWAPVIHVDVYIKGEECATPRSAQVGILGKIGA
jgi:hypothetical protein